MRDEFQTYYEHTFNQQEYDKKRVLEALCDIIKYINYISNDIQQSQPQRDLLLKLENTHLPVLMEILNK